MDSGVDMSDRNHLLVIVLALVPVLLGVIGCAPAKGPFGGQVQRGRLASGLKVEYVHYEDERVLLDSHLAGDRVIALTQGGTLLAFDVHTLTQVASRHPASPGIMLATAPDGRDLLVCQDGSIHRIRPRTLALEEQWRPDSTPLWVGSDGKSQFAVMPAPPGTVEWAIGYGVPADMERQVGSVRSLTTGTDMPPFIEYINEAYDKGRRTEDLEFCGLRMGVPSTWLLDERGRLWMGRDNGEWGGFSHSVALATGRPGPLRKSDGVYGFIRLKDGQVWAYGGTSHMSLDQAFISRIDTAQPQTLYDNLDFLDSTPPTPRPAQPRAPITHIVELASGGLIVVAYRDVFTVDRQFKQWRLIGQIRLKLKPNEHPAMARYPDVRAVHLVDGSPDHIICSTGTYGMVRVGGTGDETHEAFSFSDIEDIRPSPTGPLLGTDDAWGSTHYWTLPSSQRPQTFGAFRPNVDPGDGMTWLRSHMVCIDATSQTWAFDIGCYPGRMCLVRKTGDQQDVLAVQDGTFPIRSIFTTGDGRFWMCAADKKLKLLRDGQWHTVADLPPDDYMFNVTALPAGSSRYVLEAGDTLLLMECEGDDTVRLSTLDFKRPDTRQPWICESVALHGSKVLLATRTGLCIVDAADGKTQWDPYAIPGSINRVFRDETGRLWLGGAGLWMIDSDGQVHGFSALPILAGAKVAAIGPAGRSGGVLVSLGSRGLVFVKTRRE